MKIVQAEEHQMDLVRELFREYQSWLNEDCCFEGFEEELASLPGRYAVPKGVIYLAFDDKQAVGCSAIRPRKDKPGEAELKRLYVKETYRGHGLGHKLFDASMEDAKQLGYEAIVLETLPIMTAAQKLYREYGFKPMSAYGDNAGESVEYFRYAFDS